MKKKLTSFIVAAALVLSMPTALLAAEQQPEAFVSNANTAENAGNNSGIAPMSVASSTIGASRISSTSASVSAYAAFYTTASKATCTIILQEKSGSSWVTPTGIPVKSYVKTVYNQNSITAGKAFTVKSGKVYRAKIVFADGSSIKTRYTGSF